MSDLIGRKLGKYVLEARLGEGGMAAVFSSHHPQFHRPVAIKILPPTIGQDPSFRARFEREGRTIASLNHPNIIRIYDIDESEGLFYMVMDLLPGGTLESRLREGGLDRKWSADVIVKMAEALDYAHARGVIHRDIKPSNILLDADGQPVLADFGIARLVQGDGEPNLTSAGMVMGTPAYMAPEQLTGGQPDARSDIYSLGVVLYQLLAGRAPFTGDTMAVVSAHLTKQPPALRDYVHDLPPALDAVVLQALAKQPEHRFKSAGVFAQALRNAAADLEPGMVRVSSAAREVAAPTFSDVRLPPATGSAGQTTIASPQPVTTGQKVVQLLPVVLSALGALVLGVFLINNLFLVILLALLVGGGAYAYMYFSASTQGRKAAAETTRAISTATIRAATSPDESAWAQPRPTATLEDRDPAPAFAESAPASPATSSPATPHVPDDRDDTPEMPLPEVTLQPNAATPAASRDLAPTAATPAISQDLPPTEAVHVAAPQDLPTEAVPASPASELPTEAVSASPASELPTEAMPASPVPEPPTEAVPVAESEPLAPTVAVPAPPEDERKTN